MTFPFQTITWPPGWTEPTWKIAPPQQQPFKCPVCEGRGDVPNGFYYQGPGTAAHECRTCKGAGIIWR